MPSKNASERRSTQWVLIVPLCPRNNLEHNRNRTETNHTSTLARLETSLSPIHPSLSLLPARKGNEVLHRPSSIGITSSKIIIVSQAHTTDNMGSLFRFAEARQSSMDDRGPREEPWTGWRMLATDDSNKSETLFQRRSRPREEPWTKWRMCERDDFNGSENFMQRRMRQRSEREARRIEEALSEGSRLEEWDFITTQPGSARRYPILDYSCTTPSVPPGPWDGLNHSYSDPGNPFADEDLSTFDSESTVSDEDDCLLEPLSDLDVSGYIADLADARFELVDHDHLMYPFERIAGSWFYSSERHCRCIGCQTYCSSQQMDHYPKLCTCSDCRPTVPENPFSEDKEISQPHWENGSEEYFVEAFPELDVEGLLLDFADPRFEFIDHDDLRCQGDAPIIVQERFSVFQPHPPKKVCYCVWCQNHPTGKDCNKHDASKWCYCRNCKKCRRKHTWSLKAELPGGGVRYSNQREGKMIVRL